MLHITWRHHVLKASSAQYHFTFNLSGGRGLCKVMWTHCESHHGHKGARGCVNQYPTGRKLINLAKPSEGTLILCSKIHKLLPCWYERWKCYLLLLKSWGRGPANVNIIRIPRVTRPTVAMDAKPSRTNVISPWEAKIGTITESLCEVRKGLCES